MDAIRSRALRSVGPRDLIHLRCLDALAHALLLVGIGTAWSAVNPLSVAALASALSLRWMVAHHVMHGAYERIPGVPARYTRRRFARGARRLLDWLDWIEPEAWLYEHNHLHHAHTNELADPDLVHRNFAWLRRAKVPAPIKVALVLLAACAWKIVYYAPNALNGLASRGGARGSAHRYVLSPTNFLDLRIGLVRRFWTRSFGPYFLVHFALLPLAFAPLGPSACAAVLTNRVLAEVLTNLHSFLVIVPNHAGDDLECFASRADGAEQRYVRQVVASANYRTGGLLNDLMHMWLNYQVEHHCFPALPMSTYARIQPEVRSACLEHGIPYVQQSVFARFAKLMRVCVGTASLRETASLCDSVSLCDSAPSIDSDELHLQPHPSR